MQRMNTKFKQKKTTRQNYGGAKVDVHVDVDDDDDDDENQNSCRPIVRKLVCKVDSFFSFGAKIGRISIWSKGRSVQELTTNRSN